MTLSFCAAKKMSHANHREIMLWFTVHGTLTNFYERIAEQWNESNPDRKLDEVDFWTRIEGGDAKLRAFNKTRLTAAQNSTRSLSRCRTASRRYARCKKRASRSKSPTRLTSGPQQAFQTCTSGSSSTLIATWPNTPPSRLIKPCLESATLCPRLRPTERSAR